ncbi:S-adenosylmethionine uptake transporter [Roseiarcus fermentans]|uniref:S-adenosylmethionine uptake transporter n=1 Tax=Roseiarcus fermentans TaxID=1473586 RepID=A0A366FVX4_9HYPH|nr:DMT family transporter [Roseiarcus fermentans]RBP18180.1 S-adenosylmethionine uptake transporter [Roseiarcus fermentans]
MSASRPASAGVVLYLTGVFLFALNDALGKWLVTDYGVGQLMFVRSIGAAFVLAPMALALKPALVAVENPTLQSLRVLAMAADTFAFYWATRSMPLADVMTFYMAAPLIMTALSAPLLGERVERFRWIAVMIGFVGVVIALRPTAQLFSWASPIALMGATTYALCQTLTRKLRRAHWLQLTIWQFAGGGLIGAATLPFAWTTPTPFDLVLMAAVGIVSMLCFILIARALALTRAAALAPLQYSAILWAALMGWIVWRDVPTWPIVVGNAVIIAGGLYLAIAANGVNARAAPPD